MADDYGYDEYDYDEPYDYGPEDPAEGNPGGQMSEDGEDIPTRIENKFYDAEDASGDQNFQKAIEDLNKVISLEKEHSRNTYTLKAFIGIITIQVEKTKDIESLKSKTLGEFLDYLATTSNYEQNTYTEKLFDVMAKVPNPDDWDLLNSRILKCFQNTNKSIWFNALLKPGQNYVNRGEVEKLAELIKQAKGSKHWEEIMENLSGTGNASNICKVFSFETNWCFMKGDWGKLREVVNKLKEIPGHILDGDPVNKGVLKEAEGKMNLIDFQYAAAEKDLRESFQAYQNSGHVKAIDLLKLFAIANILNQSEMDPWGLIEARNFEGDTEIDNFKKLRRAYEDRDHKTFLQLGNNACGLDKNLFTKNLIPELKRIIMEGFVLKIMECYSVLSLGYLVEEMALPRTEVRQILLEMINSGKLNGKVDDVNDVFENHGAEQKTSGAGAVSFDRLDQKTIDKMVMGDLKSLLDILGSGDSLL